MRPLRLTLQAFGSYRGAFSVDLVRLSRHGVFAITGPTGSGKSTLFDALVFALYGDLPGFREHGNVRSQFADPDVETCVRLDFEVHGEEWQVERAPAQTTARRPGGRPVERAARVSLRRLDCDTPAVTKKAAVASTLSELVGLTQAQFEQVVLIPQGRFEAVLKADTRTRAPLLQRLFPVDVYRRVTEELRGLAAEREQAYLAAVDAGAAAAARLADAVVGALSKVPPGVEVPLLAVDAGERLTAETLGDYVAELTRLRRVVSGLVDGAAVEADAARAAADEAERSAQRYDRWREDLAAAEAFADQQGADHDAARALERSRQLVPVAEPLRRWGELDRLLPTLTRDCATAADGVAGAWVDGYDPALTQSAHGNALLLQQVTRDAEELEAAVTRYQRIADRLAAVRDGRHRLDALALRLEADRAAVRTHQAGLDELTTRIDALADAEGRLAEMERRAAGLSAEHVAARCREEALASVERLQAERCRLDARSAEARAHLDAVRSAWRAGLAIRLADTLAEGEPCPTCGSTEHPQPATGTGSAVAPDDGALADAEAQWQAAEADCGAVRVRCATAEGRLSGMPETRSVGQLDTELARLAPALAEAADALERRRLMERERTRLGERLAAELSAVERSAIGLSADRAALDADATHAEEARRDFEDRFGSFTSPAPSAAGRHALADALRRLRAARDGLEAAAAERDRLLATLDAPMAALGTDEPSALRRWLLDPAEIERGQTELDRRAAHRRQVLDRIDAYGRDGGPDVRPATEPVHLAAKLAAERHVDLVARLAVIADQAALVESGPAELEAADSAVRSTRRAFEQARSLADRCAGTATGPGASRLSLESWVLADYLRQVLVQANARLDTMTGGRFTLQLSDGVTDGRKQWGLDLSVFDAHTGQVRPATTLSGGETFMAALAMALGLADVVSGGSNHRIGALFIDEGFGYLDPQALDGVIDVLRSLEDGGRIVGVISHMEEITLALPTGISVDGSPSGSMAHLHYPAE